MGYVIVGFVVFCVIIATIVLSRYSCNFVYYLPDILIICFFLYSGIINSWDLNSYVKINIYWSTYIFCRFLLVLIIFIVRKVMKKIIDFKTCNLFHKCLFIINIIVNVVVFFQVMNQAFGAAGI
jgi:hypothetical protein